MPQSYAIIPLFWYDLISALYLNRELQVHLKPSGIFEPIGVNDILAPIISINKIEINWSDGSQIAVAGCFWSRDKKVPIEILGTVDDGWITGTMSW